jgi:hypothetical protein
VCGRHHRHCHEVAAAPSKELCGRHHRHCHAPAAAPSRHHDGAAPSAAADQGGDNGMCKSVRIHGEWVQRCHFPGQ